MPQRQKLEEAQKDLASLDQKLKKHNAEKKKAEDDIAKATSDLGNLPAAPEARGEQRTALQAQVRDLDMQVSSELLHLPMCVPDCVA